MDRIRLFLRRTYRLIRLGLHLLEAMLITGLLFPIVNHAGRDRLISYWSRHLLTVLGVCIQAEPAPSLQGGALLVCNHVSWLDIYLIHATRRVYFVSKSEVRGWPILGWLAQQGGTLFLNRGRRADTARVNHSMGELMQQSAWVAVFPEGTTSDGRGLRRFLPSLLQPAVTLGCPIIPAALRYRTRAGDYTETPAYIDEISMWESLKRIISEPGLVAELKFGEPFVPDRHRRELAAHAESVVAKLLGVVATPGSGAAVGDNPTRIPGDLPVGSLSAALPTNSLYPTQSDPGA